MHPVQSQMLACHASQCGFCTPGFVSSLVACAENSRVMPIQIAQQKAAVYDAISGNLCRCTGYRPIVDAGVAALEDAEALAAWGLNHTAIKEQLLHLKTEQTLHQTLLQTQTSLVNQLNHNQAPQMILPQTLAELSTAIAANPAAPLVAGATDVGLWLNKQLRDIPILISTLHVPQLRQWNETDSAFHIGAAVTLSKLEQPLCAEYPELHEWFERFASRPVRNAATLGGNVAGGSPIGDSMPVLLALGAQLLLQQGEMLRTVPLDAFYLAYQQKDLRLGEFIREIVIPKRDAGLKNKNFKLAVYKFSKRYEDDISAVCVAIALHVENDIIVEAKLGFGGVAATPMRGIKIEAVLCGQVFNAETLEVAAIVAHDAFTPLSDHRGSAEYRKMMCGNALRRASAEWFSPHETRVFETPALHTISEAK